MATKKTLTLEDILSVEDRKPKAVDAPEWGGQVHIRAMNTFTRTLYEAKMYKLTKSERNLEDKDWQLLKIRVLAQCLCTPNGSLLFNPDNEDQWMKLGEKNAAVVNRLFEECLKLSGIGTKAEGE